MAAINEYSLEQELCAQVSALAANGGAVEIVAGGSKHFYGETSRPELTMDVSAHSGVIDYDPAELVITLRSGCRLVDVEALLAERGQMFAFEPPAFGEEATIGGMVASGLTGPRRAFSGSIRDYLLGVKLIDGRGQVLQFGGRVIKNVAGFDLSRVMAGALGTLGIILEVSLRVIPIHESEISLAFEHARADDHISWINQLGSQPLPISASLWQQGKSHIRLSGSEQGLRQAAAQLGGKALDYDWSALKQQQQAFFTSEEALTRVSLPPACADILRDENQLIEWGGAQRWLLGEVDLTALRERVQTEAGTVCAYRNHDAVVARFQPLGAAMLTLQRKLKSSFDPAGVFNPGRLYAGL
mgnify:FL=1